MTTISRPAWLGISVALAAGTLARFWNLSAQVLGGDELHLVRAVLNAELGPLLTTFRLADASIPLCALFRLLLEAGVPMSEASLRTPPLAAGLALLFLLPWMVVRCGPPGIARLAPPALVAALVALAPPLVLYSRIVRSYSIVVLLSTVAALAFYAFWTRGSRRAAALYVASAGAALWFHPGSGPLVAAPFAFAFAEWLAGKRQRDLRPLLVTGVLLTVVAAILLGPAAASLVDLVQAKRAPLAINAQSVATVAALQSGVGARWSAALWWLLAAGGWFLLLQRAPRFAAFSATLVGGHVLGLILLSPMTLENAIVLNRYLLPATPWILVWAAAGAWGLAQALPSPIRSAAPLVAVAMVAVWFGAGPLVEPRFRHSVFAHHNRAMLYTERWEVDPEKLPPPYPELIANSRRDDRVAVYPYNDRWYRFEEIPLLQTGYRRPVLAVGHQGYLSHPGLRLRNAVRARTDLILASDARFLVAHESAIAAPASPQHRFLRELHQKWGAPAWRATDGTEVWDLDAVRASRP